MFAVLILLCLALTPVIAYASRLGPPNAICTRQTYSLNVTSDNIVFQNVRSNANESEITSYLQLFIASFPYASNFTDTYENGVKQISSTYQLSGTLCIPKSGEKNASHVQYLMHGVSFDSRYWDFSVDNDQYSYVSASADAGIATFRYDRLGTGLSEKPHDAYTIVQRATDAAITTKFAEMLRDGSIGVEGQKYTKIVGVGHSYGSILMQAVTFSAPSALDGVLLTGYSLNSSSTPVVLTSLAFTTASLAFPDRFPAANFSNAYLVSLAPQTFQLNFFYYPYYSTAVFDESLTVEQPVTQGVLFTFGTTPNVSSSFLGPVHVVTGANDWNFCYGNCYAVPSGSTQKTIIDDVKELFPVASSFSTYIPPNTGHAVNLHYTAPDTYRDMLNFVEGVFKS